MGLLLCASGALALAAGPDFTSTWVLDALKSNVPMPHPGMLGPFRDREITLEVTHTNDELQITRRAGEQSTELRYTLDGTDNINPSVGRHKGEVTSRARWDKDKLIIEGTQILTVQSQQFQIGIREEWQLSAGGRVLTIATTLATPQGSRTTLEVYNKR